MNDEATDRFFAAAYAESGKSISAGMLPHHRKLINKEIFRLVAIEEDSAPIAAGASPFRDLDPALQSPVTRCSSPYQAFRRLSRMGIWSRGNDQERIDRLAADAIALSDNAGIPMDMRLVMIDALGHILLHQWREEIRHINDQDSYDEEAHRNNNQDSYDATLAWRRISEELRATDGGRVARIQMWLSVFAKLAPDAFNILLWSSEFAELAGNSELVKVKRSESNVNVGESGSSPTKPIE